MTPATRRYLDRFRPYRGRALAAVGLSLVQGALLIPLPVLIGRSIDTALPQEDTGELVAIASAMVALAALSVVVQILARRIDLRITMRVTKGIRSDLYARLLELPRTTYDATSPGALHDLIVSDTTRVQTMTSTVITTLVPSAVLTAGVSVILLGIEWRLALVTLAFAPVLFLSGRLMTSRISREADAFHPAHRAHAERALRLLRSQDLIRLAGAEHHELDHADRELDTLRRTNEAVAFSSSAHQAIQQGIIAVAGAVLLLAGGVAVIRTPMTLGDLLSFYAGFAMLRGPTGTFAASYVAVVEGRLALARIDELLTGEDEPVYQGTTPHRSRGVLRLDAVTLSYPRTGRPEPVLRDVSLELAPGRIVALVGPNGSGKSSIVNLLLGFYRPDSGTVSADGRPYDEIDIQRLRPQFGVVTQVPILLPDTVRTNITYGRAPSDAALDRALALSGADAVVARLPAGLDTVIGEDGVRLSGGQRQRLAIARALIGDPTVLILDEPTNHLDEAAIGTILANIRSLGTELAVLIVSHHADVLDDADETIRLENGRVAEVS